MLALFVRNRNILAILSLLAILTLSFNADAADQDLFDVYSLEIQGEIYNFLIGDFDGDALSDVVVIYSPFNDFNSRYISLYLQKKNIGFRPVADYLVLLPSSAAQVNAADIDGDSESEICIVDSEGLSVLNLTKNIGFSSPVRLISYKTIYSIPQFQGIITDPFLFDINNSSGPEIVLPSPKGYVIFERGDDVTYQILNQITAPIIGHSAGKSVRDFMGHLSSDLNISSGSIQVIDGNLDGRNDIYLLWAKKLCCYFQDATGNFSQTPDLDIDFYPANAQGYFQSRLADINGDRMPDIILSRTSGGMTNAETKIRIYLAGTGGRIQSAFKKEITLSDSHCNLLIGDVSGDGNPDMIVPTIELGALAATKMFLMKKADLHLLIYNFQSGVPADEPTRRTKYEFRFDFDDPQPLSEVSLDWTGEYNGDGISDLVFSDGNGMLQFFWGKRDGEQSKRSDLEIALNHPLEIHPVHLNHGILFDAIIEHKSGGEAGRLTILKNKNNKNIQGM